MRGLDWPSRTPLGRTRPSLPYLFLAHGILLLSMGVAFPQDAALIEDFEDVSDWQQKESRGKETAITKDVNVEIKSHRDGTRPGGYLRITDRSPADHWFWIHKRKDHGCWDFSQARTISLWARGDGRGTTIRFLVADDRGNTAYYAVAPLQNTDWELKSLDFLHQMPFGAVGAVDLCRVVLIGLRTDAGHGYTFDFDDLAVSLGPDEPISGGTADTLIRPQISRQQPSGFLAPVPSREIDDSMVAVNLTRTEGEKELDLLAEAGVKWAKLGCFGSHTSVGRLIDSLLARGINVVGHLPQTAQWKAELFPDVKGKPGDRVPVVYSAKAMEWYRQVVRATAERLKGRVKVWEIGNEPDIPKFWPPEPDPAGFAKLVIETSKVLKSVDPENKVISGGVCSFFRGPGIGSVRDYLTTFLTQGAGRHIDVLGLHPYRSRAEQGARDMTQRQAADELRKLLAGFDLDLPLWDTEWQSTGAVERAEVPFATDLYQAKYMLRKYIVEADAGFAHLNWQISRPGATWDHPGQIFTLDSHPTYKYVTLRHAGALFSRLGAPVPHTLRVVGGKGGVCLNQLRAGDFDEASSLRAWRPSGAGRPDSVAIDPQNAFRGSGAMRLSGTKAFGLESVERWQPVLGGCVVDVRGVIKGSGSEVAVYPTPHDARGEEIPLPKKSRRPWHTQADYTPFCIRCPIGTAWHDFGLRIEAPAGGDVFVDSLAVIYRIPEAEVTSFAFAVRGSEAPAVFFWMPSRPIDERWRRTVDIAVGGVPSADYVLLDTFTGACYALPQPKREGEETVFRDMPLCDYPVAIVPRGVFRTTATPGWLALFADAGEIVDRAISDRRGDYLRGFWAVLFGEAAHLDGKAMPENVRAKLQALRTMRAFTDMFPRVEKGVEFKGLEPLRTVLRPKAREWRGSVVNSTSQDVNRFFCQLDDAHAQAVVHGVKIGGRALPKRAWADSPANAYTWFGLFRKERPTEVFVVVPKAEALDGGGCEIDVSIIPRSNAIRLVGETGDISCIAYWTEVSVGEGEEGEKSCTLELDDRAGFSAGTAIIDPRTGASRGQATVKKLDGNGRVAISAPMAGRPQLLVPQGSSDRVRAVLQRGD